MAVSLSASTVAFATKVLPSPSAAAASVGGLGGEGASAGLEGVDPGLGGAEPCSDGGVLLVGVSALAGVAGASVPGGAGGDAASGEGLAFAAADSMAGLLGALSDSAVASGAGGLGLEVEGPGGAAVTPP